MLIKILIGVAAAVVLVVGVLAAIVALQPSEFRIERSATIAAPAPAVFAQVNDFRGRSSTPRRRARSRARRRAKGRPSRGPATARSARGA